ncbi:hypothetical protein [Saccharibacillus deserti]|uniref:hypothetical protein n=1 Tax=Saccharibacillus deserti TaxID=1634444 RepID=UPI0015530AE4|nr:hypothetical protein [Saccharibacillus deserti]
MKRLRGEKGSALVMVMFMMLVLTLLGVAVLSAAVGGARRTLTRENDIQSLQLTQKTLDESVAYIAANLDGKAIDPDDLSVTLNRLVAQIPALEAEETAEGGGVQTELDLASGRLLSAVPVPDFPSGTIRGNASYTVTLTAEGSVNGVKRTMKQDVKVSMYPDFLNYAFGSEEDLILNGSPQIRGNIYAGGTLRVSNVANYAYKGSSLKQNSLFPVMKERSDNALPLAFVQSLDRFTLSENNYPERAVNRGTDGAVLSGELTKANVGKALGIDLSQIRIRSNEQFIRVDVGQSFRDKLSRALGVSPAALPDDNAGIASYLKSYEKALRMPVKPIEPIEPVNPNSADKEAQKRYEEEAAVYEKARAKYIEELTLYETALSELSQALSNMTGTVVFDGDLNVDGEWSRDLVLANKSNSSLSADSWLIVNGNLTVGNTVDNSALRLYSNILVTGSANLAGAINVDSTMFVLGGTTIQDAVITGASAGGEGEKEIVLISKGPILLNRIDAFSSTAQTLRGFFYTDDTAELYGVGSNFDLRGGFFAKKNLTVNAVVGNSTEDAGGQRISFDEQSPGQPSRFKVDYNSEVFEHQGLALPRVDKVRVKADKIRLADTPPD